MKNFLFYGFFWRLNSLKKPLGVLNEIILFEDIKGIGKSVEIKEFKEDIIEIFDIKNLCLIAYEKTLKLYNKKRKWKS